MVFHVANKPQEHETTQSFTAVLTEWLYASLNMLGLDVGAPSWCQD